MPYIPGKVDPDVEIRRVVELVLPEDRIMEFAPPIIPMYPKGAVSVKLTDPLNPFWLARRMEVEADCPAMRVKE